jgi:hypothetical protein
MNKAVMVRKALNLADLREKQIDEQPENIVIEKKIILSPEEYEDLCGNLFERRDYIINNDDVMYQDDEGWHCILACTEGADTGIAISSEGFDYARIACEVKLSEITVKPQVKTIWEGKEESDEILHKFNVRIIRRFDGYILDQTNADSEIRLNLKWQNHRALWSVKIFSNPEIMTEKEMTAYIGKLVKYKYALKRLREIGLRFRLEREFPFLCKPQNVVKYKLHIGGFLNATKEKS